MARKTQTNRPTPPADLGPDAAAADTTAALDAAGDTSSLTAEATQPAPDRSATLGDGAADPAAPSPAPERPLLADPVEQVPEAVAVGPTIDSVMRELAAGGGAAVPDGYRRRSPTPRLSGEQAALQVRICNALRRQGLNLRDQGQVYPWLLDQIAATPAR